MTAKPPVRASVCIPTVNRLRFFREALESAASQTFQDYEILVSVNAREPDYVHQVADVVEQVQRQHPTLTIRTVQPPGFLQIADHTNFLVDQANGDYWSCLADDDVMHPGFLATLVPLLDAQPGAGLALCDYLVIDETGTVRNDLGEALTVATRRDRLEEGFFPHASLARLALWNALWFPCALFRRSVLESFPFEPKNEAPDRDFWLRIADSRADFGAVCTRAPLLDYRLHENQYSRVTRAAQADWIRSLERSHSVARAEPRLHNRELAYTYSKLGKALLVEGDRGGAWRALAVALRKNPFDRRIYRFALQAALPKFALEYLRSTRDKRSRRMQGERGSSPSRRVA